MWGDRKKIKVPGEKYEKGGREQGENCIKNGVKYPQNASFKKNWISKGGGDRNAQHIYPWIEIKNINPRLTCLCCIQNSESHAQYVPSWRKVYYDIC